MEPKKQFDSSWEAALEQDTQQNCEYCNEPLMIDTESLPEVVCSNCGVLQTMSPGYAAAEERAGQTLHELFGFSMPRSSPSYRGSHARSYKPLTDTERLFNKAQEDVATADIESSWFQDETPSKIADDVANAAVDNEPEELDVDDIEFDDWNTPASEPEKKKSGFLNMFSRKPKPEDDEEWLNKSADVKKLLLPRGGPSKVDDYDPYMDFETWSGQVTSYLQKRGISFADYLLKMQDSFDEGMSPEDFITSVGIAEHREMNNLEKLQQLSELIALRRKVMNLDEMTGPSGQEANPVVNNSDKASADPLLDAQLLQQSQQGGPQTSQQLTTPQTAPPPGRTPVPNNRQPEIYPGFPQADRLRAGMQPGQVSPGRQSYLGQIATQGQPIRESYEMNYFDKLKELNELVALRREKMHLNEVAGQPQQWQQGQVDDSGNPIVEPTEQNDYGFSNQGKFVNGVKVGADGQPLVRSTGRMDPGAMADRNAYNQSGGSYTSPQAPTKQNKVAWGQTQTDMADAGWNNAAPGGKLNYVANNRKAPVYNPSKDPVSARLQQGGQQQGQSIREEVYESTRGGSSRTGGMDEGLESYYKIAGL